MPNVGGTNSHDWPSDRFDECSHVGNACSEVEMTASQDPMRDLLGAALDHALRCNIIETY